MTWNLITVAFGDQKYKQGQRFLTKQASECNVNHIEYSDEDLFKSELYKEYPEWMSAENNYGWFTWKPYFILQAMENLKEGDKVFLLDTLDIFHPDIFDFVDESWVMMYVYYHWEILETEIIQRKIVLFIWIVMTKIIMSQNN